MRAEIITIGNEILIGTTLDTNSYWLADQLFKLGIDVCKISSISDTESEIKKNIKNALENVDFLVITGGLGPTNDDITKQAICNYFKDELVFSEKVFKNIESKFLKQNRKITPSNRNQAFVPSRSKVIQNKCGTAPGIWFSEEEKNIIIFPGVPFEMRKMFITVIKDLKSLFNLEPIYCRTILTQGVSESYLYEKIEKWINTLPQTTQISFLPSLSEVKLRLISENKIELRNHVIYLKKVLGNIIFGFDDETLASVVVDKLLKRQSSVTIAESCTGGTLQKMITSVAGSSNCFKGGFVTYSDKVKVMALGVNKETLKSFGVVSKQTAIEMAVGVKNKIFSDYSVAITGYAGPSGGTLTCPIGTIYIGIVSPAKKYAKKLNLNFNRQGIVKIASLTALNMLRKEIEEN